jgi:predicted acyl esterase
MRARLTRIALAGAAIWLLATAPPAFAEPTPLGRACTPQNGVRFCPGSTANRVPSFDGIPLDVDVTLPLSGDGPFPTIVMMHGYGGNKTNFEQTSPEGDSAANDTLYHWNNTYFAQRGYAVLTYSARGFGNSCGSLSSRTPDCAMGWIHLADQRYEARDTQFLLGKLADEAITQPDAIGVTGISYGGGQSMELAFLRDRIRELPSTGSGFAPWTSPNGTPLRITAAFPRWPWSDLVYSLLPNGRFLDYQVPGERDSREPLGVAKESFVSGLYANGQRTGGYYAPPGADPNADITTWFARVQAGEPEDSTSTAIANEIFNYHQGFGIPGTPAPLLIQTGWADDLFPAPEALRIYNHVRATKKGAPVSLQLGDIGHQRGSNKMNTDRAFQDQGSAFFDAYLKGAGTAPAPGSVLAYTQTCPKSADGGGPFQAANWPKLHPGAVSFGSAAAQTVSSAGGNQATANAMDPIAGGEDACRKVAEEQAPGTAVYVGPTSSGYTLLGLPRITADIETTGPFGQLVGRLWDVGPDGQQMLVSRGVYRLLDNQAGRITFQLFGNGWRFEPGHKPKLELLGRDSPFLRPSNSAFTVSVSNLTVELPTAERSGGGGRR